MYAIFVLYFPEKKDISGAATQRGRKVVKRDFDFISDIILSDLRDLSTIFDPEGSFCSTMRDNQVNAQLAYSVALQWIVLIEERLYGFLQSYAKSPIQGIDLFWSKFQHSMAFSKNVLYKPNILSLMQPYISKMAQVEKEQKCAMKRMPPEEYAELFDIQDQVNKNVVAVILLNKNYEYVAHLYTWVDSYVNPKEQECQIIGIRSSLLNWFRRGCKSPLATTNLAERLLYATSLWCREQKESLLRAIGPVGPLPDLLYSLGFDSAFDIDLKTLTQNLTKRLPGIQQEIQVPKMICIQHQNPFAKITGHPDHWRRKTRSG